MCVHATHEIQWVKHAAEDALVHHTASNMQETLSGFVPSGRLAHARKICMECGKYFLNVCDIPANKVKCLLVPPRPLTTFVHDFIEWCTAYTA